MFRVLETDETLVQIKVDETGSILWCRLNFEDKNTFSESSFTKINNQEILRVCVKCRQHVACGILPPTLRTHSLTVQHAVCRSRQRWRIKTQEFFGSSRECQELADSIQKTRGPANSRRRPRKLLVLINPASGSGQGLHIYRHRVEPILTACDVTTRVFVSSCEGDASELLQNCKLGDTDGVVVVGGDGFCNECINGLSLRAMADANKNTTDLHLDLESPPIPIGIIPSGTGNWLAEQLYGSRDPVTAAVHIVRGCVVRASAVSLHVPGRLVRVASLVLHFGLIGDLMHYCQHSRWMGSARYSVLPPAALLKRRAAAVEMCMHPAADTDETAEDVADYDDFTQCNQRLPVQRHFTWRDLEICEECVRGQVYNIAIHINRRLTEEGVLSTSLGQPTMATQVIGTCTLGALVKHLTKVRDDQPGVNDFSFVDFRELEALCVKLNDVSTRGQKWYFNCDGESILLTSDRFFVRLHQKAIPLFASLRAE